jgi:hypothetical protein
VRGTGGKPVEAFQAAVHPPAKPAPAYHGGGYTNGTGPSQAEIYHMQQVEWERQQQQNQQWHDDNRW